MVRNGAILLVIIFCLNSLTLYANEITEENIRLIVNQTTGGFTLSYRASPQIKRYDLMFNDEQAASYASVNIDGNIQRLGNRKNRPVFEKQHNALTFVYNVDDITITQVFTPVKTSGSLHVNGINITFTIQNNGAVSHSVGLRMLLDTQLGEGSGRTHFTTADQQISSEKQITNVDSAKYWISKSSKAALMGSIINPIDILGKTPDSVIFAGWKGLYDSHWDYTYSEGKSLSSDSAVCYFFNPVNIEQGRSIAYSIFLTAEDTQWFSEQSFQSPQDQSLQNIAYNAQNPVLTSELPVQAAVQVIEPVRSNTEQIISSASQYKEEEILNLMSYRDLLNRFINGEVELNEQNLNEIENAVKKFRQP